VGYKHIIENELTPFLNNNFSDVCHLIQENDTKHSTFVCQQALKKKFINWVSFDLNINDKNKINLF
jgi:hypothetical protein